MKKEETCSKRINLRITPKMDKELKKVAKKSRRTLSDFIKGLIIKALEN